ncbi:hypothetical protein CTheo_8598 [Ceratobasidium theobromae]|uniref:DGQHR domain-containing protein n=1 Tax=Ceratobasidium theobromae TaxID=1582974 RepID=A0A5N5Q851_9AGAM|nr:hypothetical protein CTheo_8598 [Ceratobasidium theobromae]
MVPHTKQRMINLDWVKKLRNIFEEGVDRAAHPVQATVLTGSDEELKSAMQKSNGKIPTLPSQFTIGVFDGQHRLEAWKLIALNEQQRYWFAKVYGKRMISTLE